MKTALSLLLVLFSGFSVAHADFFETSVLDNYGIETDLINQINLGKYTLHNTQDATRYNNSIKFIDGVKSEAITRFKDGKIPYYRQYDIIHDLSALAHILDEHFMFRKQFEQTGRSDYAEQAGEYLQQSRQAYEHLQWSLQRSGSENNMDYSQDIQYYPSYDVSQNYQDYQWSQYYPTNEYYLYH